MYDSGEGPSKRQGHENLKCIKLSAVYPLHIDTVSLQGQQVWHNNMGQKYA